MSDESDISDRRSSAAARRNSRAGVSSVAQILGRVLKHHGLDQKLAKYQFVQYWPQLVGKAIAERAVPDAIRNGVLYIQVESSMWAQELAFQKKVIIARLNSFLGAEQAIRDVRFYVKGSDELAKRREGRSV